MRILLVNPPGPWRKAGTRWTQKIEGKDMRYNPYPFQMAYAISVLRKAGYDVAAKDCVAIEWDRKNLLNFVEKFRPDVVVFETSAASYYYDLETIMQVKKIDKKIKTALAGYHATATWKNCLKDGYDFVLVGEYDYSLLNLVKYLNKEIKNFPQGVAAKNKKFTPRPLIKNLDELPWPDRELLPIEKYNEPVCNGFNIVLVSSRGCPYQCSFCTVNVFYGRRNYRMRDPIKVVDEMEWLWNKHKPDELYFDDDNFAVNDKHVTDICNELQRRNLKIKWGCMCDANIKPGLIKLMKESGCQIIKIGAESLDPKVLNHLSKGITLEDIKRTIETCKKYGMRIHAAYVLGLPFSSRESDLKTIKEAIKLKTSTLQFSICTPYPGTTMYEWCKENNYFVSNMKWEDLVGSSGSVVDLPGYSSIMIKQSAKDAQTIWLKNILLHRWDVIGFHFYNSLKYHGFRSTVDLFLSSLEVLYKRNSILKKFRKRTQKEIYDEMAEVSKTGHTYIYEKRTLNLFDKLIPRKGKILDVGCGTGFIAQSLSDREWYGVDISPKSVEIARKYYKEALVADATKKIPFPDNSFDYVVSVGFLHHVPFKLDSTIKEIARVLKNNGKLLAFEHDARNLHIRLAHSSPFRVVPCYDERALYPEKLERIMKKNKFTNIEFKPIAIYGAQQGCISVFPIRAVRAIPNLVTRRFSKGSQDFLLEANVRK